MEAGEAFCQVQVAGGAGAVGDWEGELGEELVEVATAPMLRCPLKALMAGSSCSSLHSKDVMTAHPGGRGYPAMGPLVSLREGKVSQSRQLGSPSYGRRGHHAKGGRRCSHSCNLTLDMESVYLPPHLLLPPLNWAVGRPPRGVSVAGGLAAAGGAGEDAAEARGATRFWTSSHSQPEGGRLQHSPKALPTAPKMQ